VPLSSRGLGAEPQTIFEIDVCAYANAILGIFLSLRVFYIRERLEFKVRNPMHGCRKFNRVCL